MYYDYHTRVFSAVYAWTKNNIYQLLHAGCTTKLLNFGPCVEGLREFVNIKELKVVIFHIIVYCYL